MHPVAAAVTAWRHTWSWTSPAAKTLGTDVWVVPGRTRPSTEGRYRDILAPEETPVAQLVVRNLEESVKEKLRRRAARRLPVSLFERCVTVLCDTQ